MKIDHNLYHNKENKNIEEGDIRLFTFCIFLKQEMKWKQM